MNTNVQTIHQMGFGINEMMKQATGREAVSSIEHDWVSVEQMCKYILHGSEGKIATFDTNITDAIVGLIANIEAVQSGTGDPAPNNIRPITGWTETEILSSGKNLCNLTIVQGGIVAGDGSETSASNRVKSSDYILFKAGTKYTINASGVSQVWLFYYDCNKQFITGGGSGFKNLPFTKETDDDVYVRLVFRKSTNDENLIPADVKDLQIELGETATAYEPYTGESISVVFPEEAGTVYGGSLDVLTGVLTVTHIHCSFLAMGKQGNFFYNSFTNLSLPAIKGRNAGVICNRYITKANIEPDDTNNGICVYDSGIIRWVDADYIDNTYEEFNTAMGDNRIEILYELATPVTYQLTPQQVSSLIGENNIYCSTGSVSVEYKTKEDLL